MYLFIHINKCGGTSFKEALKDFDDVFIPKNDDLISISCEDSWANYKKFTIVRNPIDRVMSLQGMMKGLWNIEISVDEILDIIENDAISHRFEFTVDTDADRYIKRHGLPLTHPHYQVYKNGQLNVDKYWRLEELNSSIDEINEFLGRKIEIKKLNTSKKKQPTDREIERIKKVYAKDFEVFYSKSSPDTQSDELSKTII